MKRGVSWILVNDKKEILLQKRTADYHQSKQWTLFGGGIEEGECPEDAVEREMKEELGLDIKLTFIEAKIIGEEEDEEEIYLFKGELNDISKISLGEGNGFAFFSLDEIKKLDCPNIDLINNIKEDILE